MKTSKFEEILRRKLESLKPDFQEKDWGKFQSFQQHAAPSFWQSNGHWLGYAVAVTTTAVAVLLYVGQSRQNETLLREMQQLRQQMNVVSDSAAMRRSPEAPIAGTDRIAEARRSAIREIPTVEKPLANPEVARAPGDSEKRMSNKSTSSDAILAKNRASAQQKNSTGLSQEFSKNKSEHTASGMTEALPTERLVPADLAPLEKPVFVEKRATSFRSLAGRIPRDSQKSVVSDQTKIAEFEQDNSVRSNSVVLKKDKKERIARKDQEKKTAEAEKAVEPPIAKAETVPKTEKADSDESLLPKFGLNLPYRVGITQRWEGRAKASGAQGEVILGEHWAAQLGFARQKPPVQRFLNEQRFKDETKEDFRKRHGKRVPTNYEIYGITINTTVTQIPLGITYRNDVGKGFTYFAGVGTTLNLTAKQELNFQFKRPSRDFGEDTFTRTAQVPLLNNLNLSLGLEKRWSPIVLQVVPSFNTRFQALPFLRNRTNLGLRVNVLYEFGAKK